MDSRQVVIHPRKRDSGWCTFDFGLTIFAYRRPYAEEICTHYTSVWC